MPRYVLRVWLDDRPGALGAVASRIGSVKGDLVGIEILERGAGRVIDELIVDLPSSDLEELMIREVQEVDGVDVENVSIDPSPNRDSRVDPLLTAALVIEQDLKPSFFKELLSRLQLDYMAIWVVAFDLSTRVILDSVGDPPLEGWIKAYLDGLFLGSEEFARNEPADLALGLMRSSNITFVLGRKDRPFRDLERNQLDALARICDVRASWF